VIPQGPKRIRRWSVIPKPLQDEAITLYSQGLSSRQVAKKLTLKSSSVSRICREISRDKVASMLLAKPSRSSHWRTCRQVSRRKVERALGRKLSRLEHVHHKNGDYTDKDLPNLEVLTALQHMRLHNQGRHKAYCKHGHPLKGDNLFIRHRTKRGNPIVEYVCRECSRRHQRESYYRDSPRKGM